MNSNLKRLLSELSDLLPPRDRSEAEAERFYSQLGNLQGRAALALWAEMGACKRFGCCATASLNGWCSEHAAEATIMAPRALRVSL